MRVRRHVFQEGEYPYFTISLGGRLKRPNPHGISWSKSVAPSFSSHSIHS
jgi:hypothetical protein